MNFALWDAERERLAQDAIDPGDPPEGMTTTAFAFCNADAEEVKQKAMAVLRILNQLGRDDWPPLEQWTRSLPTWFVASCRPEYTQGEADAELRLYQYLSPDERLEKALTESWALSNWLAYLAPDERQWYWWNSEVLDPSLLTVTVVVPGFPFPSGSLSWLLRAAGADQVSME